jgi:hypothetical protein
MNLIVKLNSFNEDQDKFKRAIIPLNDKTSEFTLIKRGSMVGTKNTQFKKSDSKVSDLFKPATHADTKEM